MESNTWQVSGTSKSLLPILSATSSVTEVNSSRPFDITSAIWRVNVEYSLIASILDQMLSQIETKYSTSINTTSVYETPRHPPHPSNPLHYKQVGVPGNDTNN